LHPGGLYPGQRDFIKSIQKGCSIVEIGIPQQIKYLVRARVQRSSLATSIEEDS